MMAAERQEALHSGRQPMQREIATIHDRMAEGGNWYRFREEIAQLHEQAQTQEEFVTLLEAHHRLVAVAQECFDPATSTKLRGIAYGEYKAFLLAESQEQGLINPLMLNYITAREVEAGRLAADDPLRQHAAAGATLGDSAALAPSARPGNYIALASLVIAGGLAAATGRWGFLWIALAGFIGGWALNERDRRANFERTRADRAARGY